MHVHCSIILKDDLPPKEKDQWSFNLPSKFNVMCFDKALANLGASVGVMTYSTCTNLGLGKLAPTKLVIELADKTVIHRKAYSIQQTDMAYSDQLNTAYQSFDITEEADSSYLISCITRSSTKELFTPFKDPKLEFCSSRKLFKTLSLDGSRSHVFDLFFDLEENYKEGVVETGAKTMEEYMSKTQADYGPNGKLIHNSIINGPYVRRMILEPGDPNREVPVNETFPVQTDDELTEKELKQIEATDQAIQTILLVLPEDIYAAVDSCKTAQEIWLRVQQMMKGSDIRIQEKKAKLFNEWERFTSTDGESIESYHHCLLKLMNDLKLNQHFPEKIASNLKFLNNLQPEWSRHVTIVYQIKDLHTTDYTQLYDFLKYNQKELDDLKAERLARNQDPLALMATSNNSYTFLVLHQDQPSFNQNYMQQPMPNPKDITDPTTAMNMALTLMAKAFKLNYSTPTNNNQRISSNPCNRQIAQPGMNMGQDRQMQMIGDNGGKQFRQYAGQNVENLNGYNDVQNVRNQVIQNLRVQN
nr:hypothetical protein [Tanacetum cinerariifolium]